MEGEAEIVGWEPGQRLAWQQAGNKGWKHWWERRLLKSGRQRNGR